MSGVASLINGGQSYDPAAVVRATHDHVVLVLSCCAVSFIGAYLQYFGAITRGFRDRTHSIPLIGNLWFFAHDTTYVVNFQHWFRASEFWLVKAFWFALLVFAICESVVTVQILRFSRQDLFPGLNLAQSLACYLGLQLFAYGMFWWFQSMIRDPYYLLSFSTTVVLAPLLNIGMMRSRGSRRGFSMTMMVGFVLLCVGFWAWAALSDEYFRKPFFLLIAAGSIGISVAGIMVFRSLPEYQADPDQPPPAGAGRRSSIAARAA